MANKETINKVRSLLDGHVYGPLREAAEKWLSEVDDKYDVKEKAGQAWDKLGEAADKLTDASEKFSDKMGELSDKVEAAYVDASEKAGPAFEKLADYAEKVTDTTTGVADRLTEAGEKLADASEKLAEKELIKQLKEGINSVGDLIQTFGSKEAEDKFGKEMADKIKTHAEELKEKGIEFCDCEACTKAREILKDFGEDLSVPAAEEVEAEPVEAPEE